MNQERVWTEESRAKASESHKVQMTPEAREHLAQINRGKKASDETKAKMSAKSLGRPNSNKGKTLSDETRKRMSESRTAYWAAKRLEKVTAA
jgi:hypothetical protein